jgi:hypothetical protein
VTTELVDEAVWRDVGRRRGPSTWVVVVAIVIGAALVWGAFWARGTGRTSPHLTSNGMSGEFDAATSSIDFRVRPGNTGDVPITVVGASIIGPYGSPATGVRSVTVTPTVIPVGAEVYDDGRQGVEVPMHVVVDCTALDPNQSDQVPTLALTTTGTWPQHDWARLDVAAIPGFCDPPAGSGS